MDYYRFLGVERDADIQAIAAAVGIRETKWRLSLEFLDEAWKALSGEESRRRYDESLAASVQNDGEVQRVAGPTGPGGKAGALLGGLWRAIVADFAMASSAGGIRKWAHCDVAGDSLSGWLFFGVGAIGGELAAASWVSMDWPLIGGNQLVALGLVFVGMFAGGELALMAHRLVARIIGGKRVCRTAAAERAVEGTVVASPNT